MRKMKKLLVALVLVAVLFGCSGGNKPADVTKKGSYQSAADDKGSYDVVELTLVNDKITEVKIDTFYGPKGEFKSVLKDDYGMRVASEIGK
ncbi:MAG: hypothetical protein PUF50_06545 [Erysipelotrichaceae bacterium]|nr:hypothetical protein [Erysipelotrichaceae bacterium]